MSLVKITKTSQPVAHGFIYVLAFFPKILQTLIFFWARKMQMNIKTNQTKKPTKHIQSRT